MISNDLHGMSWHDSSSSHLIENLSSSRYYLFLHLVSSYTFLDFYLDIVDMLVPWMSLGTRNIRKYKIQSSDISSAGNTRSHAVAAVARCCWLLLAPSSRLQNTSVCEKLYQSWDTARWRGLVPGPVCSVVQWADMQAMFDNTTTFWEGAYLLRQVFKRFKPIVCSSGKGSPNP